eukprot:6040087-Pyramimonas_sp.AAC.1
MRGVVLAAGRRYMWRHKQTPTHSSPPVHPRPSPILSVGAGGTTGLGGLSSFEVAGTPCPMWSRQRRRSSSMLDFKTRQDFLVFVCWAAQRLLLQEDLVVHENVKDFPIWLLETIFASVYVVSTAILDVANMGFPVNRERRVTIMIHKRLIADYLPRTISQWTWAEFAQWVARECGIDFRAFLLASSDELESELAWASSRRSSRAYTLP